MRTCNIFSGLDKAGTVNFLGFGLTRTRRGGLVTFPPPSSRWVRNNEVSEGNTPFVFNPHNVQAFKNVLLGVQRAG